MSDARDNFTQLTSRTLCDRVGGLCSNPACQAPTKAAHTDDDRAVSVGVACHIHAAAPGGPRYDASQSPEQRSSIENGIWLCALCGTLVDKDEARFPAVLLREWRTTAEQRARKVVGKPFATPSVAGRPVVELTLDRENKSISAQVHHYQLIARLRNTGTKRLDDWYMEIEFPTALLEPGTAIGGMVRERSDANRFFLRTSSRLPPIHVGDEFKAGFAYRVNDDIYRNRRDIFDLVAKARAFVGGELVAEIERPIRELQCF